MFLAVGLHHLCIYYVTGGYLKLIPTELTLMIYVVHGLWPKA